MQERFPLCLWSNPRAQLWLEILTIAGNLSSKLLQHEQFRICDQWLNFDYTSLALFFAFSLCGRHPIELEECFVSHQSLVSKCSVSLLFLLLTLWLLFYVLCYSMITHCVISKDWTFFSLAMLWSQPDIWFDLTAGPNSQWLWNYSVFHAIYPHRNNALLIRKSIIQFVTRSTCVAEKQFV